MARFLQIPALVTDPEAPAIPWSLGIDGANHRWDPSLLNVSSGTVANTLADSVGDHVLNRSGGSIDNTITTEGAITYIGNLTNTQKLESAADRLLTDQFTAVLVARAPAGYSAMLRIGGYLFEYGGNGRINLYSYPGTTGTQFSTGVNYGTTWHVVVATLDGANTRVTVDGTHMAASALPTPTNFVRTSMGQGINPAHIALAATWPTLMPDADRLTVHNTVKARLGL